MRRFVKWGKGKIFAFKFSQWVIKDYILLKIPQFSRNSNVSKDKLAKSKEKYSKN